MFTADEIKNAEKYFSDKDWQPPEPPPANKVMTPQQIVLEEKQRARQNEFLMYFALGITQKEAAEATGIDESTVTAWKRDRFSSFSHRFSLASNFARRHAIAQVHKHSKKDWRAAAWWLERKFSNEFGEVKKQQVDINFAGKLDVNDRRSVADRFLGLISDESFGVQTPSAKQAGSVN